MIICTPLQHWPSECQDLLQWSRDWLQVFREEVVSLRLSTPAPVSRRLACSTRTLAYQCLPDAGIFHPDSLNVLVFTLSAFVHLQHIGVYQTAARLPRASLDLRRVQRWSWKLFHLHSFLEYACLLTQVCICSSATRQAITEEVIHIFSIST